MFHTSHDGNKNKNILDSRQQWGSEDEKLRAALDNYEIFHHIPKGTATLMQVQESSQGIDGFANWDPKDNKPPQCDILENDESMRFVQN